MKHGVAHEDDLRPISLVFGIGTHHQALASQNPRNKQHEVRPLKERKKLQSREREIERGQEKRGVQSISNWKREHSLDHPKGVEPHLERTPESRPQNHDLK